MVYLWSYMCILYIFCVAAYIASQNMMMIAIYGHPMRLHFQLNVFWGFESWAADKPNAVSFNRFGALH